MSPCEFEREDSRVPGKKMMRTNGRVAYVADERDEYVAIHLARDQEYLRDECGRSAGASGFLIRHQGLNPLVGVVVLRQ